MDNWEAEIVTIQDIKYLHIKSNNALFDYNVCKLSKKDYKQNWVTTNSFWNSNCPIVPINGITAKMSVEQCKKYLENAENKIFNIIDTIVKSEIITISNLKYLHNKSNNAVYLYTNCLDFINRYRGINMKRSGGRVIMSDGHYDGNKIVNDRTKTALDLNTCKELLDFINNNNSNNINLLIEEEDDNELDSSNNNNSNNSNSNNNNKINIPQDNINICFVGGVSTGKSTILNAIFCEQLTQCKIKRTTMVPTVYIENNNSWNPFDKDEQTEAIFKQISDKNQEIIALTENGHKLKKEEYSELVFNVGKLDINILPDSFVNVYDIPGLNDARTKDVYYEYLEDNFHKFNLVIFLVDIHSGLNTSDEMEIVNFITTRTKEQLENNNRKIYTLVVVNKADDMRLDEESNDTDKLELTGELSEMYEQVEKTLTDEFQRKNVAEQLIGIIPLCAIDAYLYRMVKKHGQNFKLSPEQILKIGVNENGKKFSTLKPATQEKKVYEILNDKSFIETMIKLSGFSCLEKILHKFLNENDTGKQIRIDNLLYDLRKLPKIERIGYHQLWLVDTTEIKNLVKQYCDIYSKIKEIDSDMYKEHMVNMLTEILNILNVKVKGYNLKVKDKNISELIVKFNTFKTTIIEEYFNEFKDIINEEFYLNGYPLYLVKHVISGISDKFNTEKNDILKIYDMFNIVDTIGSLNKEIVEQLLDKLITNVYERNSIDFEENTDMNLLVTMLTKFQSLDIKLIKFIRFLLINRFVSLRGYCGQEKLLWNKMLSYQKRGEVAISNWVRCTGSTTYFNTGLDEISIFINWKPDDGLDELDLFYLNYNN